MKSGYADGSERFKGMSAHRRNDVGVLWTRRKVFTKERGGYSRVGVGMFIVEIEGEDERVTE